MRMSNQLELNVERLRRMENARDEYIEVYKANLKDMVKLEKLTQGINSKSLSDEEMNILIERFQNTHLTSEEEKLIDNFVNKVSKMKLEKRINKLIKEVLSKFKLSAVI